MGRKNSSTSSKKSGRACSKYWYSAKKRGIRSAADLLKILFIYACQKISFRMLAVTACALGIAAVSDTSLRKHFSKATCFLYEILNYLLPSFIPEPDMPGFGRTNIKIKKT